MWACNSCSHLSKLFCLNKHIGKCLQVLTFAYLAWIFRLLEVANCRLQTSHLYGFSSPWCIRLWNTNWHFWAKPLSQSSHLYGFSPREKQNPCTHLLRTLSNPLPEQSSSVCCNTFYKEHLGTSHHQSTKVEHARSIADNRPFLNTLLFRGKR